MDITKIKPTQDRVLLKRLEIEEKTSGGIYIPTNSQEQSHFATVIAIGPGKKDSSGQSIAISLKIDDIVYLNKYAGTDLGDQVHLLVREDEILGVVEK